MYVCLKRYWQVLVKSRFYAILPGLGIQLNTMLFIPHGRVDKNEGPDRLAGSNALAS